MEEQITFGLAIIMVELLGITIFLMKIYFIMKQKGEL